MLFPTLEPSSLPVVVAQPDERHANRTASVLEWYDRHRAQYNIWFKRSNMTTDQLIKETMLFPVVLVIEH